LEAAGQGCRARAVHLEGLMTETCEVPNRGGERLDRCASVCGCCEQRLAGCVVANHADAGERVDVRVVADAGIGWPERDGRCDFFGKNRLGGIAEHVYWPHAWPQRREYYPAWCGRCRPVTRARAASSCTRNVESVQNGPVDSKRCSEPRQLSWTGVAAAEIAMERCQGHRLAGAVSQPHKVYDGVSSGAGEGNRTLMTSLEGRSRAVVWCRCWSSSSRARGRAG
jgi:hypothetical protein